jgi:thiol-disulfide isomerase/thioredoxin
MEEYSMTVRRLIGGTALCLVAFAPCHAQTSVEELENRIDELTRRIEVLEKERAGAERTAPRQSAPAARPAASAGDGREEALELYRKIDGLVATGNNNQARRELAAFEAKYEGTKTAGYARSLKRELEVVGKPAPEDWSIEKWFQGESEVTLDGQNATLLVFWESWCPHCRTEVPKMQSLYDRYKDKGLQVVGVTRLTRDATEESVASFIAEQSVAYPIAKESGALAEYFNVKGIPAAAMVRHGKIVWRGHPIRLTDELLGIWF